MAQFSVHDAKTNLCRVIAEALADGDVVIIRGNVPVARLVLMEPRGCQQFGALKGKVTMDARFDEPLPRDQWAGRKLG